MYLIGVVIDVNISFLSLVSTVFYSITCLEALCVEAIEKIGLSGRIKWVIVKYNIDKELYAEEQFGKLLRISYWMKILVYGLEVI